MKRKLAVRSEMKFEKRNPKLHIYLLQAFYRYYILVNLRMRERRAVYQELISEQLLRVNVVSSTLMDVPEQL
jgi:hypothetical protein